MYTFLEFFVVFYQKICVFIIVIHIFMKYRIFVTEY